MGYLIGYGGFAIIQTVLTVVFTITVFKIHLVGSIWLVFLTNLLLALVALTLGIFISTFANSEFQMIQFIPLIVVPQIFFAGLVPVDGMAPTTCRPSVLRNCATNLDIECRIIPPLPGLKQQKQRKRGENGEKTGVRVEFSI